MRKMLLKARDNAVLDWAKWNGIAGFADSPEAKRARMNAQLYMHAWVLPPLNAALKELKKEDTRRRNVFVVLSHGGGTVLGVFTRKADAEKLAKDERASVTKKRLHQPKQGMASLIQKGNQS